MRVTIPGGHVVVPVQIAGSHQCEQRVAGSLCGLVYLLALGEEGVEVDNGAPASKLGKRDTVLPFVVKVCILRIICFLRQRR